MLTSILTVVHLVAAIAIVALVLLQQGKGADMGAAFGSGSSGSLFGARGSANFLSRSTSVLAAVFFVTGLTLAYLYGQQSTFESVTEATVEQPASNAEQTVPEVPVDGETESPTDVPSVPDSDNNANQ